MIRFEGIGVDVRGRTDIGKVRRKNQDHFLVAALHKVIDIHETSLPDSYRERFDSGARALLFLVADGVGGGPSGEVASTLTLDAIMKYVTNSMRCFYKLDQVAGLDLMHELATSVQESHIRLRAESAQDPEVAGMATFALVPLMTAAKALQENLRVLAKTRSSKNLPRPVTDHNEFIDFIGFTEVEELQLKYLRAS